ncbi:MAG: hypothetical protein ACYTE8_03090 [Planctomycetota bacterium]
MFLETSIYLATFTVPEQIGLNAQSTLWLLPIAVSISVVYKALKVPQMKLGVFMKEVVTLFISIMVFIAATALVLFFLAL